MSNKRKAVTVLVRAPKKPFQAPNLMNSLLGGPSGQQRAEANRASAILIRQARMNAMPLQRVTPQERNYVDATSSFVYDTTGTIALIATIAQGASTTQRIGKKAVLRTLQIRGFSYAGTTAIYNDCAFIIVYDKRPTGVLPAITDILVTASATAMNNDNGTDRFQILRRMDFELTGNTTTPATGREAESMDSFVKINRKIVFKAAGTGAIGDIQEGALYALSVGINVAGTTAAGAVLNFRTRFTED